MRNAYNHAREIQKMQGCLSELEVSSYVKMFLICLKLCVTRTKRTLRITWDEGSIIYVFWRCIIISTHLYISTYCIRATFTS